MWNDQTTFKLRSNLPSNEVGEDFIVLDSKKSKAHELNPLAKDLWTLLKKEQTLESLTAHLLSEYEVEETDLKVDLVTFLEALANKELIDINE